MSRTTMMAPTISLPPVPIGHHINIRFCTVIYFTVIVIDRFLFQTLYVLQFQAQYQSNFFLNTARTSPHPNAHIGEMTYWRRQIAASHPGSQCLQ